MIVFNIGKYSLSLGFKTGKTISLESQRIPNIMDILLYGFVGTWRYKISLVQNICYDWIKIKLGKLLKLFFFFGFNSDSNSLLIIDI